MRSLYVIEFGQWQGSGAPTAQRLRTGASHLAELVPAAGRQVVKVEDTTSEICSGVQNAAVLAEQLNSARAAVRSVPKDALLLTVGGDCSVELAAVEAASHTHRENMAVVWFDAHADLHSPETSPSGAFHGMVLRSLTGEGPAELSPAKPLTPGSVVLAGTRSMDPGEQEFIDRHGVRRLSIHELDDPALLVSAVRATGAETVYLHIDLDVLDPTAFPSVGSPEPSGLSADSLLSAVRALTDEFRLAGLGITEYERPDHLKEDESLLRGLIDGVLESAQRTDTHGYGYP